MNRKRYTSDPRYSAVLDNMDLLGITDVSTKRQDKNGTIQWRLPLKNIWPGNRKNATYIEVASFKAGYVRRQNGCYTPYQLNKRPTTERYYKDYKTTWNDNNTDYTQEWTGKYNKYTSKGCKLIPIEIDRLEYLISYCLKNYYIKHANFVAHGEYIPKWTHEWELERANGSPNDCGHYDRIRDLENAVSVYEDRQAEDHGKIRDLENKLDEAQSTYGNNCGAMERIGELEDKLNKANSQIKKLDDFYEASKRFDDSMYEGRNDRVKELEDKLAEIIRIAEDE